MHDFDYLPDRRNTNSTKWDGMEKVFGVSPDDGIAMWVADMDFPAPPAVNATLHRIADHGVHGYFTDTRAYLAAITNWMDTRHDWTVNPDWILSSHGLVAALGMCLQTFTLPGDGVVVFSPVYHAFGRIVRDNNRTLVESELVEQDGIYTLDLDALADQLTGSEKMMFFCSPHNPGGRVWTQEELASVADFCVTHDLMLVTDEVHHDLVFPGHTHTVMANAAPHILDRLIMLTAPSKTFNLAGMYTGNIIIPDPDLRAALQRTLSAAGFGFNRIGAMALTAAYAHGAGWLDDLLVYLDANRQRFDARINSIPGLRSMPLQATYLAWVDFSGTGMSPDEIQTRVFKDARIAANIGASFGKGGESYMRFNLATNKARLSDALERLDHAFEDLQ